MNTSMRFRRRALAPLCAALLALLVPLPLRAQAVASWGAPLVLERLAPAERSIAPRDPLLPQLMAPTWVPPRASDTVAPATGGPPQAWRAARLDERGTLDDAAVAAGGYVYLTATRTLHLATENVERLRLDGAALAIDGQRLALPALAEAWLARSAQGWQRGGPAPAGHKTPQRGSRLQAALGERMLFVVGTQGQPEENAWALHKARYDAEFFGYRGNGAVEIVTDQAFLQGDAQGRFDGRSLVLYGHAGMHAAWAPARTGAAAGGARRGARRRAHAAGRRPAAADGAPAARRRQSAGPRGGDCAQRPGRARGVVGRAAVCARRGLCRLGGVRRGVHSARLGRHPGHRVL